MNKKIPMRMCAVTRQKYPKKELIRIVKDKDGALQVDLTGKKNGHGAYLLMDLEVLNKAKKSKCLDRLLEVEIPDSIYDELEVIIKNNI